MVWWQLFPIPRTKRRICPPAPRVPGANFGRIRALWARSGEEATLSVPHPDIVPRHYDEVRGEIRDADLVLSRGGGLIAVAGRSIYRHAAMAVWWHHDLFVCEMLQWSGGRAVTLRSQVRQYPGRLDVFETAPGGARRWPNFHRVGAARFMRRLCGRPYNYWGILALSCLHLPVIRLMPFARRMVRRGQVNATVGGRVADDCGAAFCSEAFSAACRIGGGVDPVPMLADRLTEPADLARSQFLRYRFTLEP